MKGQETQTESPQVTANTCAAGRLLDKFERKARARPRHHQPVPSQYRTWWGHGPEVRGKGGCGLVVGRGEKIYSRLLLKSLLGGTSCWDDRPPKRGNLRGNRWVHALRVEREGINIVAGRKATTHRGIKQVHPCLARVGVAQCGRQVHLDQTKAVKGQDRKTLVTAGAIKRPLPCPVDRVEKQSIFYNVKRKREQEEKKKR